MKFRLFKMLFGKKHKIKKLKWDDVTVKMYMDIQKAVANEDDDITKMSKVVDILYDIDLENIPISEATEYMEEANKFLNSEYDKSDIRDKYKVGRLQCNIVGMNEMTMSLFMDFQECSKNANEALVDLIACCLVPKGHKYNNGYDIAEFKKDVERLPITVANSIVNFQMGLLKKLSTRSLAYLAAQTMTNKQMTRKEKKAMMEALSQGLKAMDFFPTL